MEVQKVTGKKLEQLVEKQLFRCNLTDVELTPEIAEADHIKPVKDGGKHCMSNIQIVHTVINRMKGTLSQEQFIEWCCRVADKHRRVLRAKQREADYEKACDG